MTRVRSMARIIWAQPQNQLGFGCEFWPGPGPSRNARGSIAHRRGTPSNRLRLAASEETFSRYPPPPPPPPRRGGGGVAPPPHPPPPPPLAERGGGGGGGRV